MGNLKPPAGERRPKNMIALRQLIDFHNWAVTYLSRLRTKKRTVFDGRVQWAFDDIKPLIDKYLKEYQRFRETLAVINSDDNTYVMRVVGRDPRTGQDVEDYTFTRDNIAKINDWVDLKMSENFDVDPHLLPRLELLPDSISNIQIRFMVGLIVTEDQIDAFLYPEEDAPENGPEV